VDRRDEAAVVPAELVGERARGKRERGPLHVVDVRRIEVEQREHKLLRHFGGVGLVETSDDTDSGERGAPPTISGVVSPTRRLNSRATRSGSVIERSSAASPYSVVPSSRNSTTEGTAAVCVPREMISARPSRHAAAAVNVVPRSTPSTHATAETLGTFSTLRR